MSSKTSHAEKYFMPGTKNHSGPRQFDGMSSRLGRVLDERLRDGWMLKPFLEWLWHWGGKIIFLIACAVATIVTTILFATVIDLSGEASLGYRIGCGLGVSLFVMAGLFVIAGFVRLLDTVKDRELHYNSECRPLAKQLSKSLRAISSAGFASDEARDAVTRRINRALTDLTRISDVEEDLRFDKYRPVPFTDKMTETLQTQVADSIARARREITQIEAEVAKVEADSASAKALIEPNNDQVQRFAALQATLSANTPGPATAWSTVPGLSEAVAAKSIQQAPPALVAVRSTVPLPQRLARAITEAITEAIRG